MADINSVLSSIIRAANEVTDMNDATVTSAVQSLMDGYGQGGGLDFLKFGTFDISRESYSSADFTVTTISDIGFEPKHIFMFAESVNKVEGAVHVTELHNYGGTNYFRKSHRWTNNAWANQTPSSALTNAAAGALWLDGDVIKVNATTTINFKAGKYYWLAIGTPNI